MFSLLLFLWVMVIIWRHSRQYDLLQEKIKLQDEKLNEIAEQIERIETIAEYNYEVLQRNSKALAQAKRFFK